jgi:hypothetical protein
MDGLYAMTDHETIREWLRSLDKGERKVVKSEVAKWNSKSRRTHAGGRPKVLHICPKCGGEFGSRQIVRACPEHGAQ